MDTARCSLIIFDPIPHFKTLKPCALQSTYKSYIVLFSGSLVTEQNRSSLYGYIYSKWQYWPSSHQKHRNAHHLLEGDEVEMKGWPIRLSSCHLWLAWPHSTWQRKWGGGRDTKKGRWSREEGRKETVGEEFERQGGEHISIIEPTQTKLHLAQN